MPHQVAVTVRAWLTPSAVEPLNVLLGVIAADIEGNPLIQFGALTGVHFARFVILPEARDLDGRVIPPSLVYAANADGDGSAHLHELARDAATGLDRIFEHCVDYPEPAARTTQARFEYLDSRRIPTQAFYVNTVGRTARQVREEARLRDVLQQELDRLPAESTRTAHDVHEQLRAFVAAQEPLRFAQRPAEGLPFSWRVRERAAFFGTLLGLLLLSPLLLALLPLFLVMLRHHEKSDARKHQRLRISAEERVDLRLREDHVVQNQISAVGNVKPSRFRHTTLRVLLAGLDFAAKHVFNRGDLGTVSLLRLHGVDTIHFAQWIVIDEGRRVLFFSNYDGSLASYMDDFVNKVAWGLNAVFSNGVHYPPTRWLFLDGAYDEQQFKAFLHRHQIPTQAWYSAHRDHTAINVANNAAIRAGLARRPVEGARAWAARL